MITKLRYSLFALLLSSSSATADPINWTIDAELVPRGGSVVTERLFGSFTSDSETGALTNINLTIEDASSGLELFSYRFTDPDPVVPNPGRQRHQFYEIDPAIDDLFGESLLIIGFNSSGVLNFAESTGTFPVTNFFTDPNFVVQSSRQDCVNINCTSSTIVTTVAITGSLTGLAVPTICDIQLNQTAYIDGDTVNSDVFRFANLSANPLATEIKIWLGVPGVAPISVTNVGADGSVVFPAGMDIDYGPFPLFPVSGLPLGEYELSCRLLDPVTGELLAEDRNFFEVGQNKYAIGDTGPAGGIVFYVTNGGLRGLEAAPVDQVVPIPTGPGAEWGCEGTAIAGADGTAIGTGAQNTADILAGCATPGIAARLADAYSLNGFDDWFLPSRHELNELYLNKDVVGGFADTSYWSSSEVGPTSANFQLFFNGSQSSGGKGTATLGVRAIRAF